MPDAGWLNDNYFHDTSEDDWVPRIEALVEAGKAAPLPLRRLRYGQAGGRLRYRWDRKRALGGLDRSVGGYVALAIGFPVRALAMTARRARGLYRAARRPVAAGPSE
jgi:hypothetical protein